jgi:hypothetical protein
MKTVSLKLSDALHARLTKLAKQRGAPKSAVLRDALDVYLATDGRSDGLSCLDLAGDLVGSIAGPSDLSTNKRHLRGYGR